MTRFTTRWFNVRMKALSRREYSLVVEKYRTECGKGDWREEQPWKMAGILTSRTCVGPSIRHVEESLGRDLRIGDTSGDGSAK